MPSAAVERIYAEFEAVTALVDPLANPSLKISVSDVFRKHLLMTAASWFEAAVTDTIARVALESLGDDSVIVEFLRNKGLSRQFHTYFDWESSNAWKFFGLFGRGFIAYARDEVARRPELAQAISAFVEVGRERNRMAHQDYGSYILEKTAQEIFDLYKRALPFVDGLEALLTSFPAPVPSA